MNKHIYGDNYPYHLLSGHEWVELIRRDSTKLDVYFEKSTVKLNAWEWIAAVKDMAEIPQHIIEIIAKLDLFKILIYNPHLATQLDLNKLTPAEAAIFLSSNPQFIHLRNLDDFDSSDWARLATVGLSDTPWDTFTYSDWERISVMSPSVFAQECKIENHPAWNKIILDSPEVLYEYIARFSTTRELDSQVVEYVCSLKYKPPNKQPEGLFTKLKQYLRSFLSKN